MSVILLDNGGAVVVSVILLAVATVVGAYWLSKKWTEESSDE